jgi:kynurenine formamidase
MTKSEMIIDLTMKVSPKIKVFPGSPQPRFSISSTFDKDGYDSEVMHMSTHTGTHMDAPSHFSPGNISIDDIPASRFVSEAILINIPKKADELISIEDISDEKIKAGDTVVFATGWESQYKSSGYMTKNPGLSSKAAEYLVNKKKINAVAIDCPSIDAGFDSKFSAHNILLPSGAIVVENLCNLSMVHSKRFILIVAPLKLAGASGSPIRALALVR